MGIKDSDMARGIQLILVLLACSAVAHAQQEAPASEVATAPTEHDGSPNDAQLAAQHPADAEYEAENYGAAATPVGDAPTEEKVELYDDEEEDGPATDGHFASDPAKEAQEELECMDTDKDGKVSLEEIKAYFKMEFYSDDLLEGAEAGPASTTSPAEDLQKLVDDDAKEFLEDLDKDKDGYLSLQELIEQYKFDPTAPEYQDSSPSEAEDDDQEEAYRFQEDEEDEFLQESDDEYSGAEYVDSDDEDTNDKDEYSESSSYLASTEGGPAAEDGEAHMATATGPAVAPAPEY